MTSSGRIAASKRMLYKVMNIHGATYLTSSDRLLQWSKSAKRNSHAEQIYETIMDAV